MQALPGEQERAGCIARDGGDDAKRGAGFRRAAPGPEKIIERLGLPDRQRAVFS
jgi:hypothetical protein